MTRVKEKKAFEMQYNRYKITAIKKLVNNSSK